MYHRRNQIVTPILRETRSVKSNFLYATLHVKNLWFGANIFTCTSSDWFVNDSSNIYQMFLLDLNRGLIHLPIIINTHFFDSPSFGEKKNPVLLQLHNCYAFEPNGAYLCKDWRSYWLWISRALVQIWLL